MSFIKEQQKKARAKYVRWEYSDTENHFDTDKIVTDTIKNTAREYLKIKDHEKRKAAEFLTHPDYKNIVNRWIDKCNELLKETTND